MKYQKLINLLGNTPNQLFKFRTKNCVEINNNSLGTSNSNSQIKYKTLMLKSILSDYSDACILIKGSIKTAGRGTDIATRKADEGNKGVIFEHCVPFTDCKTETNNTQIGNIKDLNIVMSVYNIIECSDNYSIYLCFRFSYFFFPYM